MGINREISCKKILAVEGLPNPPVLSGVIFRHRSHNIINNPSYKSHRNGDGVLT